MTKRISIKDEEYFKIMEIKGKYGTKSLIDLFTTLDFLADKTKLADKPKGLADYMAEPKKPECPDWLIQANKTWLDESFFTLLHKTLGEPTNPTKALIELEGLRIGKQAFDYLGGNEHLIAVRKQRQEQKKKVAATQGAPIEYPKKLCTNCGHLEEAHNGDEGSCMAEAGDCDCKQFTEAPQS